jgi:hypothetical protein
MAVSEGFYLDQVWMRVLKYIMLFIFILIFIIYLSDVVPKAKDNSEK